MRYTRQVLFVADVNRVARFYIDMLGFEKHWHAGSGALERTGTARNIATFRKLEVPPRGMTYTTAAALNDSNEGV
ncbi:MAG: hypothetical protein EYC70_13365 [Planctomycetota bacterium]|nr:MAG: hypothetical protein EYC70_13365 [Planctomycetota bacterium]